MSGALIFVGAFFFGWAGVAELRKGRPWEALGWLVSGLLFAVFVWGGPANTERWVLGIPLTLFMMLSLTLAWRSGARRWRGE